MEGECEALVFGVGLVCSWVMGGAGDLVVWVDLAAPQGYCATDRLIDRGVITGYAVEGTEKRTRPLRL
jgi:hypothetical protein